MVACHRWLPPADGHRRVLGDAGQRDGSRRLRLPPVGRAQPSRLCVSSSRPWPGIRDRNLLQYRDHHVLAVLRRVRKLAEPDVGSCRGHSLPADHAWPSAPHAGRRNCRRRDVSVGPPTVGPDRQGLNQRRSIHPCHMALRDCCRVCLHGGSSHLRTRARSDGRS